MPRLNQGSNPTFLINLYIYIFILGLIWPLRGLPQKGKGTDIGATSIYNVHASSYQVSHLLSYLPTYMTYLFEI
jgi:hypothetical protein